jgi:ABC-2 type transport system ATP-binding protein
VLHELSPQQASLEEAFMQLTAESVEYHAHSDAPGPQSLPGSSSPPSAPPAPQWGGDWKKG